MDILKRFLNYISIDTTSDSKKSDSPTSLGQRKLAKVIMQELKELNVDNLYFDNDHCYIYAKINGSSSYPSVGFVSHLDTSEDERGSDISPNMIVDYDGQDICLNDKCLLTVSSNPDLKNHIGKTIITTDGTTLLGADDKAGIAEIMGMLEHFTHNDCEHGDILVCFTPDEEIGMGTDNLNLSYFNPDIAFTIDGSVLGELSYENFNAATANISIKGINTHPGTAKDKMVNAVRLAIAINSSLPLEIPENTENYEGFYHLEEISGDVSYAKMKYLIRDFSFNDFEKRKKKLTAIVNELNKKYNNCIELDIQDKYFNMHSIIKNYSDYLDLVFSAIAEVNVEPIVIPVRGGTDGANISQMGIPCPNIGTGGHNFHSIYEYICLEDMQKVVEILISIVNNFSKFNKENVNIMR